MELAKRKIIHVDMDYFFAQVEIRDNPRLKGHPVAIGGSSRSRGVLSTCNYVARKFGVRSAMPTFQAVKLCPGLILVPSHFEKYREASAKIFEIFRDYTELVQGISLDEAYLDVTECSKFQNSATLIAQDIKKRIYEETGLTASAGVSYNKLLAKISSDLKKPNGLWVITPENVIQKIKNFPVSYINGVGKVTQKKMDKYGIKTFGDLYSFSQLELISLFGSFGPSLYNYARGIDNRAVCIDRVRKSLSTERTFREDKATIEELVPYLESCYEEMQRRLNKHNSRVIKSIFVKIKYADFKQTTIESQISNYQFHDFKNLFLKRFGQRLDPVRLVGLGVRFSCGKKGQLEFDLALNDDEALKTSELCA